MAAGGRRACMTCCAGTPLQGGESLARILATQKFKAERTGVHLGELQGPAEYARVVHCQGGWDWEAQQGK